MKETCGYGNGSAAGSGTLSCSGKSHISGTQEDGVGDISCHGLGFGLGVGHNLQHQYEGGGTEMNWHHVGTSESWADREFKENFDG